MTLLVAMEVIGVVDVDNDKKDGFRGLSVVCNREWCCCNIVFFPITEKASTIGSSRGR